MTNTGTGAAQNVQVVDNLPAGMQTADGKGKIVLDAGTLAAGESRRVLHQAAGDQDRCLRG